MDAPLKTNESFRTQAQKEHHKALSPLLKLTDLDPVLDVFLKSMHLFFLNVSKDLFEKLVDDRKILKLSTKQRQDLQESLQSLSVGITMEFQRKKFDLSEQKKWKATHYRFIILYIFPFLFRNYVTTNRYNHLLLLFVSVQILFSEEHAVKRVDYANTLLRKFFKLMPSFYDEDSQTVTFHNLIHVCHDVRHMKAPLSKYDAFPNGSFLGTLKKLIRTPNKPLSQVANRLKELQSGPSMRITKNVLLGTPILENQFAASANPSQSPSADEILGIRFKN
ncbi:hypothetical protein QAD02_003618 [Eretmocerus hayati]|uniref:Uncharacterized protein n=1 Tax=Eretmocerus hayati TaxID=131215 RepID=A0ACC2NMP1_9HYME|nr:hypothetical protein QAD02_003618 [Eretmocerus hayati]